MPAQKLFLNAHNFNLSDVHFLAQDMSPRRYHRLLNKGFLLMESPPEVLLSYTHVAKILTHLGTRVPLIKVQDGERAIIEDWGDNTLTNLLSQGHDAAKLYHQAIEVLVHLHKASAHQPQDTALDTYHGEIMVQEALLFSQWCSDTALPQKALDDYQHIWQKLYEQCPSTPKVVVLRDYHVDNIMRTPQNDFGVLDFQDALWGPCMYDVTSLLQDARVDIPAPIVAGCLQQYRTAMQLSEPDWNDHLASYTLWGLGRHLKILGVFTRYAKKAGNTSKLVHIPRVWSYVDRAIQNPVFDELRAWMETWGMCRKQ